MHHGPHCAPTFEMIHHGAQKKTTKKQDSQVFLRPTFEKIVHKMPLVSDKGGHNVGPGFIGDR